MATALATIQIIDNFYVAGAGGGVVQMRGREHYFGIGGGGCLIRFVYATPSAKSAVSSIILPNGAKYDPYQTYAGPQTPGMLDVSVTLTPDHAGIAAGTYTLNQTESAIQYYHRRVMTFLNKRGEITGANADNDLVTATARLIGIEADWKHPKQIPSVLGGQGQNTPGVVTASFVFTFDMLTPWEWT